MTALQDFVNKHYFNLLVFTLTFGIILYEFIGFDYTDEICALLLLVLFGYYVIKTPNWKFNKAFFVTLCIFLFYLLYSFVIQSNIPAGIVNDFVIQIKPYLAFFCVYSITPLFSANQRVILKYISLIFWGFLCIVGIGDLAGKETIVTIMGHAAYYAAAVISVSLCYLYSTNFTLKNRLIFILLLSIGILSGRAKFLGFYAFAVVFTLYFSNLKHLKLNIKTILIILFMFAVIILLAWNKIELYFMQNITADSDEKDLIARFVLYSTSFDIFRDYFPFGSGFGSFATFSSGLYYSDIYSKYGIEGVWGISRSFYSYIADTYYPSLAQFGVVGVILYISFWIYIFRKGYLFFIKQQKKLMQFFFIIILITAFFAIEGTSDSTFTTHRGFFILMILGMTLTRMKSIVRENIICEKTKVYESITD